MAEKGDGSDKFDDDGSIKRTGTVWTASAQIITAVIGTSGLLWLPWAIAQLGWIAGPAVIILFSFLTHYTSTLLAACYRCGDPVVGERNYTYTAVVRSNLGGIKVKLCGLAKYANLMGVCIAYTIVASASIMAIKRSHCFHNSRGENPCHVNSNIYLISFGATQIVLSQIPNLGQLQWLSVIAAAMSFTYSTIGLGLGIAKVIENGVVKGSLTGISVGIVTPAQKIWRTLQALGDIAFAYSYSSILTEIQDTVKSPPPESKTMNCASSIGVGVTTLFYLLYGCFGYAAFGNSSPGNVLSGFGFYNPFWLLDIANVAIVIHLVIAYQVYCQTLYAFVERHITHRFPNNPLIKGGDIEVPILGCQLSIFKLVWRTIFVVVTTLISMLVPFFNEIVGLVGAIGYWPLTVYFPVEMYIVQKNIPKWSTKWMCLKVLSVACLIICVAAAAGSVAGIVHGLQTFEPFKHLTKLV